MLRFPPGLCFVGQQLVDRENLEGSEFYTDLLSPLGMCHFVGVRTLEDEGVAALVGFHRPADRAPFDPRDATMLGLLFPHLAHAALVQSRMTQMHAHVEALMAGNRLRDAADQLEITEGTARSYLKRVLRKTGAQRQSDLVRVVLSGLVPLTAFADDVRPLEPRSEGIDRQVPTGRRHV